MPGVAAAAAAGHRAIVRELANACILRFADVRGVGAGLANASCCACVKLAAAAPPGQQYRYGNSQAHLLDPDAVVAGGMFNPGNHAERQAHAAAGAGMYGNHLFVELPPCPGPLGCAAWAAATIPGINIWWLYPTTAAMTVAHAGGTAAEFLVLNAALP